MQRLRAQPVPAVVSLVLTGRGGAQSNSDGSPREGLTVERAAMILDYRHDELIFGELPPGLTPVREATVELEPRPDRRKGAIDTRITPGQLGRVLAVVLNNPDACTAPTPVAARGPPSCSPLTAQFAIGFGRVMEEPPLS